MLDELRVPCVAHVKTMMLSESQYVNVRNPRMQDLIVARGRMRGGGAVTDGTNTNGKDKGKDGKPGANNSGGDGELGRTQTRQLAVESAARALNGNRFELPASIQLTGNLSNKEAEEHSALRDMVEGYFTLCKETTCDQVPKIVNTLLIQKFIDDLYPRLMKTLFKESEFEALLAENPQVATMRKATTKMMLCLQKAQQALDSVRDIPVKM